MKGTRIKTLWSINGRAPDSHDVWDETGLGLKVGRVDIPASLMIVTEGYTSVKYRRTMSTGEVADYESIMEALTIYGTPPVVETVHGSGIMTFFTSDTESTYPGIFKIDVVKEWDNTDPEPEPIPDTGATHVLSVQRTGNANIFSWQYYEPTLGRWVAAAVSHDSWSDTFVNSISYMSPAKKKALQEALGTTTAAK